jgi:hypothetical protein
MEVCIENLGYVSEVEGLLCARLTPSGTELSSLGLQSTATS